MKSYRFLGEEAEVLGGRLDAARKSLANAKTPWARVYWASCVERLLFQWKQLPVLHDAGAMMTIVPRWTVDYNYYEKAEYTGLGIADRAYNTIFRDSVNLDASWENHRAERLARTQF